MEQISVDMLLSARHFTINVFVIEQVLPNRKQIKISIQHDLFKFLKHAHAQYTQQDNYARIYHIQFTKIYAQNSV